ncbi:DUF1642 domain-containing protein [Enterococcus dongliensis]|uniref:DUF1642 domain-containing protein n=1 Tax=Enterococcus dongliensis TaxID=2559925 RepID=UPI0028926A47|nr:DUF1642 domain-containing protein [Enterococcus dongliensis]MDT2613825.1 DUF1642 domain-containing protein [Enterococcus dongliensis]
MNKQELIRIYKERKNRSYSANLEVAASRRDLFNNFISDLEALEEPVKKDYFKELMIENAKNGRLEREIEEMKANEPEKVKVPKLVAEWIELCKEKADLSSCLNGYYEIGDGTIVRPRGLSETFYDWLSDYDNMHDLARAYTDGYEVEEEPKWVVKSNRLYFTGITQLIARDPITYNFTTDEKRAHVFDDKESAEKEASFFDGAVEKAEE